MRKVISVAALLMALTCSVHAGDMPNGSPAPPSEPTNAVQEQTNDGDISTTSAGSLTQIALDLLATLPPL